MKKFILFLFSLFLFIPVLNAEEVTYYDWEQVEVQSLPDASSSTLNKVYIFNDKYYITNSVTSGGSRSIALNDNIRNKTIEFNFPENYFSVLYNLWLSSTLPKNGSGDKVLLITNNTSISSSMAYRFGITIRCNSSNCFIYMINDALYKNGSLGWGSESTSPITINNDLDYLVTFIADDDLANEVLSHIKLVENISINYSWQEVDVSLVFPVIPNKIYVPTDNLKCYKFIDKYTLRGYLEKPILNQDVIYYDFYLDQHYNSVSGTERITNDVICLDNITSDYLYRHDIIYILIFFIIVSFFVIYLPIKILFRLFRRFN